MRPHGTPADLEKRRRHAVELLEKGATVSEVAQRIGCSHSSVILWRNVLSKHGIHGLKAKPAPGRPPKLGVTMRKKLTAILLRGAMDYGYNTDLWTTRRISDVIHREFHIRYDRSHVGRLLVAQGWSCQKPERRALERDEDAIRRWKQYRWSAIKKKPKS
jgi:transposase